jgi:hypothetical protein
MVDPVDTLNKWFDEEMIKLDQMLEDNQITYDEYQTYEKDIREEYIEAIHILNQENSRFL